MAKLTTAEFIEAIKELSLSLIHILSRKRRREEPYSGPGIR